MTTPTMRAARFCRADGRLRVAEVPVPQPGPSDVLVRVEACGICLSDVHMIDGTLDCPLEEVTPGHEPAGTIARVGAEVPYWQPGRRVVIAPGRACGSCRHCGDVQGCLAPQTMGQNWDGAWAQYVVTPFQTLVEVPDGVPIEQAAICADAVATPFSGIVERGGLRPGERAGVWGVGGLGVHAVQIARLAGASLVVAVDPLDSARRRALEAGADHAFDPTATDVPEQVRRLTDGEGLDLTAELSGAGSALAQAVSCLGRYGRAVMIGMSPQPIHLTENTILFGYFNHSVLGHDGYTRRHLTQLMRLLAAGRLDLSRSVSEVLPLEEITRGVERLRTKAGDPVRLVVRP
ncbi:zinc-binding dehydrogenase [Streptomyces sp. H51]|uniref:zinc-binding dehydrogenase n=1 Tax=Streptomyces sp. H51 TaxID=3111770 RepID=UPI002D780BCB|nr:zinc-binding dehydrogenase [Streptomyces sp. H51]